MVLESLLFPLRAEKKPWLLLLIGFLYCSIAVFLSLWIFRDQSSLTMVFFTVIACIPLVYNTLKLEESKDMVISKESTLLKEHNKALVFLLYLFLGITLACVLWYVVLPTAMVDDLFARQTETIQAINKGSHTGNVVNQLAIFAVIVLNNFKVLTFAILFAFLYGAGAIFILTWNATVIGTAIGNFIRTNIDFYLSTITIFGQNSYFHIVSIGLLKYALHGIPEIAAYFYGGLAGSIISVALIRKHYQTKHFRTIIVDFCELVLIAVGFLLVAGFLEVYVTPILF